MKVSIKNAILVTALIILFGCAQPGYKPPIGQGSAIQGKPVGGGEIAGTPLSDPKWRAMGITTVEQKEEFLKEKEIFENRDIHFDFDSYALSDEAKAILDEKAEFLRKYPLVTVTIEGHCDERGTNEYNLALGERRAHSAWQYLVNLGIDPDRMTMISYGEEKPIALGHDEESWAKNRRAHFVLHY